MFIVTKNNILLRFKLSITQATFIGQTSISSNNNVGIEIDGKNWIQWKYQAIAIFTKRDIWPQMTILNT